MSERGRPWCREFIRNFVIVGTGPVWPEWSRRSLFVNNQTNGHGARSPKRRGAGDPKSKQAEKRTGTTGAATGNAAPGSPGAQGAAPESPIVPASVKGGHL